jgi:hypothetical protein
MFNNFFPQNRAVYEIISKNMVEAEGAQMAIEYTHARCLLDKQGYMHARACTGLRVRISKHTQTQKHTHTQARAIKNRKRYIIFIAFPQQQWFRERASILRYTYIACLVDRGLAKAARLKRI